MLLRWAGVVVLYSAGLISRHIGGYDYSLTASNVLAPVVLAYNVLVWRQIRQWEAAPPDNWGRSYRLAGNAQCMADLTVLAIALHYSGGIESYGGINLIAVLVVAGLVLPAVDGLLQAGYACLLFNFVVVGEANGWLSHVDLGRLRPEAVTDPSHVASVVVLFNVVTVFIVCLVVFIAQRLRRREDELAHLYGVEHETKQQLQEADRLKSDFLSTVSHELRTPLTAITGFAHHLTRNWDQVGENLRLQEVDAIQRQAQRLQRLVEDLLDFSAIEADRLMVRPEILDLERVISAAIDSSAAEEVGCEVPDGLFVLADPRRVEQIVVNLLDNAVKYGAAPVEVKADRNGDEVEIAVQDAGSGVPPDKVDHLFTRFYQVDAGPTRASTGVGLGLALVRGYAEALGGRVWYEQTEGGGARFVFALRAAQQRQPEVTG